jgi:cytochrome c
MTIRQTSDGGHSMKFLSLLGLAAALVVARTVLAAGQATPDEAKAMAIKAAEYLKSVGPEKAFPEFDARDGPWRDRDLYVFVDDTKGVMVANGTNPGLIGKSVVELRDVDGKAFHHEILAIADAGWVDFKWRNPVTNAVEPKTTYEVRVGDYIVGVGAYVK